MNELVIEPGWIRAQSMLLHIGEAESVADRVLANARATVMDAARPGAPDPDALGPLGYRHGSLAVINISGPLSFGETMFTRLGCGATYAAVAESLDAAVADPSVERILLDIDSPGGTVAGVTEGADAVARARLAKPVTAFVHDMACSGGYWLAAAASEIVATPTAKTGSIGVIVVGYDESELFRKNGRRPVVVTTAGLKRGHPGEVIDETLTEHARDNINEVDRLFVGHVAAARGLDAGTVSAFDGRVFTGDQGVAAGLVDRISSPEALYAALTGEEASMATDKQTLMGAAGRAASAKANGSGSDSTGSVTAVSVKTADDMRKDMDAMDDEEKKKFVRSVKEEFPDEEAESDEEDEQAESAEDDEKAEGGEESGEDKPAAESDDEDEMAESSPADDKDDDKDGEKDGEKPKAAAPLAYAAIKAIVHGEIADESARARCITACLEAGVTGEAGVLHHVLAEVKQAAPTIAAPEASASPRGGHAGSGGGAASVRTGRSTHDRAGDGPKQTAFFAAVADHQAAHGADRRTAIRAVAKAQPALHNAYMAEIGAAVGV